MLRLAYRTTPLPAALAAVLFLVGASTDARAQAEEGEEEEAGSVRGMDEERQPGDDDDEGIDGDIEEGDDDDDDDEGAGADEPPGPGESMLEEKKPAKAGKKGAKKNKKTASDVRVRGRVFVRDEIRKNRGPGTQWQNDIGIASARINVDVSKYGWLRGGIEVELGDGDVDLKDVNLQIQLPKNVELVVGNFKRPISPIALEGLWQLPLVERGILADDIQLASFRVPLNLGGRSLGGMLTYRGGGSVKPQVSVALMRAELPDNAAAGADNLLRDVYVRGQIEPIPGFRVGGTLVAFTQVRFAGDLRTRLLGSLDISLETDAFRVWLEGFAGRTPFFDGAESIGALTALRFLGAPVIKRPISWVRKVEPFVSVSALELSDERQDDRGFELGGGFAAYFRKQIRLQIEYTRAVYEDNFPQNPAMGVAFLDSHTIRLQLGTRLR